MNIRSVAPWLFCAMTYAMTAAYAASSSSASPNAADKQFLAVAARTDMTEAHEGQLAQTRAAKDDVKAFARTLVQDDTDDYARLTELAAKIGVSIPKGIDAARNRTIEELQRLKGNRFDREFARDEIQEQRQAIAVFKREAEHGGDTAVKNYAAGAIPILEKHLHNAEACAKPARHS